MPSPSFAICHRCGREVETFRFGRICLSWHYGPGVMDHHQTGYFCPGSGCVVQSAQNAKLETLVPTPPGNPSPQD